MSRLRNWHNIFCLFIFLAALFANPSPTVASFNGLSKDDPCFLNDSKEQRSTLARCQAFVKANKPKKITEFWAIVPSMRALTELYFKIGDLKSLSDTYDDAFKYASNFKVLDNFENLLENMLSGNDQNTILKESGFSTFPYAAVRDLAFMFRDKSIWLDIRKGDCVEAVSNINKSLRYRNAIATIYLREKPKETVDEENLKVIYHCKDFEKFVQYYELFELEGKLHGAKVLKGRENIGTQLKYGLALCWMGSGEQAGEIIWQSFEEYEKVRNLPILFPPDRDQSKVRWLGKGKGNKLELISPIEYLQYTLNSSGFSSGRPDGKLGIRTKAAFEKFVSSRCPVKLSREINDIQIFDLPNRIEFSDSFLGVWLTQIHLPPDLD